jgi:hypothetical protein
MSGMAMPGGAGTADGPRDAVRHAALGTGPDGRPTTDLPAMASEPDPRRWLILTVIAVAQLMVVLDGRVRVVTRT